MKRHLSPSAANLLRSDQDFQEQADYYRSMRGEDTRFAGFFAGATAVLGTLSLVCFTETEDNSAAAWIVRSATAISALANGLICRESVSDILNDNRQIQYYETLAEGLEP